MTTPINNNSNNLKANSYLSLDSLETTSHDTLKLYCGSCGATKEVSLKCSSRTCEECRKRIYFKLFKGWNTLVSNMESPKMLTLTTRNVMNLSKDEVKKIRSYFIRLTRRKYYRERIIGGLYVIELKNIGNGWNIHLHALIDTISGKDGFLVQQKISSDWFSITKNSKIVDIRQVKHSQGGLRYLLKYLVKSPEINGETELYNRVLKGSRLIQTFGKLYACKPEKGKMLCEKCGFDVWVSEYEIDGQLKRFEKEAPPSNYCMKCK